MKQGTILIANQDFIFKTKTNNKKVTIRVLEKQRFWVTSTELHYKNTNTVLIARQNKGCIGSGYMFSMPQINQFFNVIKE